MKFRVEKSRDFRIFNWFAIVTYNGVTLGSFDIALFNIWFSFRWDKS